ncbi:MAG: YnbE family lipoprotein [Rickettsiales bacterium]|nr:YnbE family lipoprotein [Pseudomonadota bacterium]MDA0965942.1 YnbE family lipoprotein [Pseudomonadota bacterium]MDG4542586.1 YnbE family lipoprotein [Rickettsiales bacterium]MDG4545090.1 YnbE family lipoprotein [Rickettsiales bacterium]MDG4547213.1 YnbE family lipoprotein [Rickettsiales bacterium]
MNLLKYITLTLMVFTLACTKHEVKFQAPDKPIEINLNINIDHRVKVEIEKDLEKAMSNSDIF